jgi:hypothetical protein
VITACTTDLRYTNFLRKIPSYVATSNPPPPPRPLAQTLKMYVTVLDVKTFSHCLGCSCCHLPRLFSNHPRLAPRISIFHRTTKYSPRIYFQKRSARCYCTCNEVMYCNQTCRNGNGIRCLEFPASSISGK